MANDEALLERIASRSQKRPERAGTVSEQALRETNHQLLLERMQEIRTRRKHRKQFDSKDIYPAADTGGFSWRALSFCRALNPMGFIWMSGYSVFSLMAALSIPTRLFATSRLICLTAGMTY